MSSSPAQDSSKASFSPARSPSHSMSRRDVPLETLVTYLLASKRSLSSISTVWRANEIVQSARTALEDSVLLSARTAFFRTAIEGQCKVVRAVRRDVEKTYKEGERDFKVVIRHLDAANARLESTMDTLRSTMVEAAFRPAGEEPRSLLDFVDEQGVESMRDALKESIKESQEAKTEFDSSLLSFDNDIRAIISTLKVSPSSSRSQSQMLSEESPLPGHLHELEGHAQEMASLLDSLVRHFDLCVSAIRHTEGGYAAVRKAASNTPEGAEPVSVSGVMNNESDAIEEPISEEERIEMVSIVENDAEQVEDVVQELRELVGEMEVKLEAIQDYVATRKSAYKSTIDAWTCLETVALRIPSYIIASHEYKTHWLEIKEGMATQMEELEHMRIFYESYHSSYDGLILEVARRKTSEDKVKSIMRKAMEQVKKVYEADMAERGAFREEVGEYLPNDLYPGVADLPPRWGVQVLEKSGELDAASGAGGSTPSLDMEVVEAAGRREKERMRHAHHR